MSYLIVDKLQKTFTTPGGRIITALNGISFEIPKGKILAVIGHNGSGKTTLLNCIRGDYEFDSGSIKVFGKNINQKKQRIVSVYQDVNAGVVGSMTAMENLTLMLSRSPNYLFKFPCNEYRDQLNEFLNSMGLGDRFRKFETSQVADLSGGQRQQLAILMAMLRNPEILLLDEFIANLDPKISEEILEWTQEYIRKRNITTIMVTHDHKLAATWSDLILELNEGQVARYENSDRKEICCTP